MKKVVLVGHCGPDSSYLVMSVKSAIPGAAVVSVEDEADLQRVLNEGADLILMNRQLDYGFAESLGADLIARIHRTHPRTRLMLVSNYEDAQSAAIANGALPGFGKRELGSPRVKKLLADALSTQTA